MALMWMVHAVILTKYDILAYSYWYVTKNILLLEKINQLPLFCNQFLGYLGRPGLLSAVIKSAPQMSIVR